MTETIACPHCRRLLVLPQERLGQLVQCPSCQETFTAELELRPAPAPRPVPPSPPPTRRNVAVSVVEDDDDYLRDRGRSHRGGLILALGVMSIFFVFIPLISWVIGGSAISMANTDLVQMELRNIDRSGKGLTQAGKTCAWIGVSVATLYFLLCCMSIMNR